MKPEKPFCPWGPVHPPAWDGEGRAHWGPPPRHWFFMRILFLFFWACVVLTVSFFAFGGLALHNLLHAFWIVFLVMLISGMLLGRMFRPLRWLLRGVQEISNGNLDFRLSPPHGRHGEIQYLAEQFNRMAGHVKEMIRSKEQLLLDVSHELRSPLTRLKVALEMSPKGRMRDSMMQDIGEMEAMLAEILETEHLRSPNGRLHLSRVRLTRVVREVTAKYRGRKPGVRFRGGPPDLVVEADEARTRTVLQNVLENALKYSSRQGKAVEVEVREGDGGARVSVRDFGRGIPPEELERVFEPFYRVDKSRAKDRGGYGLGLSLCREIMRAHGGEITLESGPGKGTCARIYWPGKGAAGK